jgi:methylenetetrahydrofolate dehydrogenase (NADP+)/methenyltetrahydrofolate cyclohydrolase
MGSICGSRKLPEGNSIMLEKALVINGKELAKSIQGELSRRVHDSMILGLPQPHLVAVLVGDDPASKVYVRNKQQAAAKCHVRSTVRELPISTTQAELESLLNELNRDDDVHGILVQLPLPSGLDESRITSAIIPEKDVDCFHPMNVGLLAEGRPRMLPCTPAAVVEILWRSEYSVEGKHVVVVGRSNIVGKPLALMMLQKNMGATVTVCHTQTRNLAEHTQQADVLVAAAGRAGLITGDMLRPGVFVIDVGTNRTADGRLVGDVDFESAVTVAQAITPVPGGVGPMTCTMLVRNTIEAAAMQAFQASS